MRLPPAFSCLCIFFREYLLTSRCLDCFESAVNRTKACGFADGVMVVT
ncbi:hypothetical protein Hdeb2414_s0004g00148601 [Helianthus debilis subsp. tardiflorus]